MRLAALALLLASSLHAALVGDVRAALRKGDFAGAEELINNYRRDKGVTSEFLAALSWMARGSFTEKKYDDAERYAAQTKDEVAKLLKTRKLDDDNDLPIALGAAIEVEAQILNQRGERDLAVDHLRTELAKYRDTSIRTRLQKNINLLSLEGKPAPELEITTWLGPKPQALEAYKGKPVLLFFWAHWCPDCKEQAPIIGKISAEFVPKGLVVIGPTQYYGYAEKGRDVGPADELKHIEAVRKQHYAMLLDMPVPVSQENFRNWGGSTTPTLALIDSKGIVRLYNPGKLSYEELARRIKELLPAT